ncbi:MaoC family dehydratase [Phyllobacterium leguminum]|uniref:Acyl dehydratase n=1 Tax=Phyllobacterium leguminum TaxID=314237 RepID=A0A318T3S7_9HYPH|nr:MaoC family dehydratase [Phyllobacterium leguminum]PYE87336.1 acyl dehydratase [Phyllobacterium leguminum]
MSLLEEQIGVEQTLGSYTFTADAIIRFATLYDPQPFHIDPEAAKNSHFGALCASGWHTTAVWMKLNVQSIGEALEAAKMRGEPLPDFGPSPGFENLKWLRPVFAGDTITYKRTIKAIRPLASRPGWSMLNMHSSAYNQDDVKVLEFDSAALVRV